MHQIRVSWIFNSKLLVKTFSLEDSPPITGTYLRCTAFFCLIASLQCMGESPHGTESWTFRTGKLTTPLTVEMSPPGAPRIPCVVNHITKTSPMHSSMGSPDDKRKIPKTLQVGSQVPPFNKGGANPHPLLPQSTQKGST